MRCIHMDRSSGQLVAGTEFGRLLLWDTRELDGEREGGGRMKEGRGSWTVRERGGGPRELDGEWERYGGTGEGYEGIGCMGAGRRAEGRGGSGLSSQYRSIV